MNISHILEAFYAVAEKEGWHAHHTPKNLAAAISVESAELLEQFMWLEDGNELTETQKQAVGQEIADVAMYLVVLCDKLGLSIDEVIANKLALNAKRHSKTTK